MNALDLLDEELTRIDSLPPRTTGAPLFLWLKDGHSVRLRFLLNFPEVVVLKRHNKYSQNKDERVNAICASHVDQSCSYCELAEHDKELEAKFCWYLPVYTYYTAVSKDENSKLLKDEKGKPKPVQLTYKNKDGDLIAVCGFRILELPASGALGEALRTIRNYAKDPDYNCYITGNDYILEKQSVLLPGAKKPKVTVTLTVKPAKEMTDEVKEHIPTFEALKAQIIEALQPVTTSETSSTEDNSGEENDFPF